MDYVTIIAASQIKIGDDCLIASHVSIINENHGMNPSLGIPYIRQPLMSSPVVIGNNVWIGEGAFILPGVTIGDNSIIGAGSVVTKDIPDSAVAAGNPAKVIKVYDYDLKQWVRVPK